MEEKKEIDTVLSETLNNTDSDTELEKELAELLNEEDEASFPTVPSVPETRAEVETLEQRLKDLRMEGECCRLSSYILSTKVSIYIQFLFSYTK